MNGAVSLKEQDFSDLAYSAPEAAKRLLGCEIERVLDDGTVLRGRIIETEAYDETDPGSHTYKGISPRNRVMYRSAGYLYVYFIYGMHFCCNIVTGSEGKGEAVLIRAIEPLEGEEAMRLRRKNIQGVGITNGPSKVCMALDITRDLNGHDLHARPLRLLMKPALSKTDITTSKRIGLKKATETLWRFYVTESDFVSKKF